jgi:hypothetical protein
MIFYLFPRDTFVGIATYRESDIPELEVSDELPERITLLDYYPPMSVRFEIPSAVNALQALGYYSLASLGDAALNPHQWTFQFPLFLNAKTKSFLDFILDYINRSRPVAIWAIARSPDGQEYTHFVSRVAVLTEINLHIPPNGYATISLTFSSPFSHIFQDNEPALNTIYPPAANERGVLIRDLKVTAKAGERQSESEKEIMSLTLSARRQITWVWTTFDTSCHSLGARRAATMFAVSPITPRGNLTLGYPFNFSLLQDASLQPLQEVNIYVRDLMTWTLLGFKINSWTQDFSTGAAGLNIAFSFLDWLVS